MAKLTDCWQRKQLQAFVHLPLRNPDSIRLLKVESADPHDVVRCSIQEFKLSERPSYTALSYVWEDYGPETNLQTTEEKEQQKAKQRGKGKRGKPELDPKKKRTFICNGKHLQVGASLFAALTGLRKEINDGYMWIDAICINQEDECEQSAQVAKMTTMYGGADFVFM